LLYAEFVTRVFGSKVIAMIRSSSLGNSLDRA